MSKDMNMTMALFMAQGAACFYCGCEFDGRIPIKTCSQALTRDHVKPAARGYGKVKNTVLACLSCNRGKKDREPTPQEVARAAKIWGQAVRHLKAFNGQVPPTLGF